MHLLLILKLSSDQNWHPVTESLESNSWKLPVSVMENRKKPWTSEEKKQLIELSQGIEQDT